MTKTKASHYTNHRDMVLMKLDFNNKSRTCEIHRERGQRRKLTPTVRTASFSKESAIK